MPKKRALSDIDIIKYASILGLRHFRGVFSRDTLPASGPHRFECAVVNQALEIDRGTHWTAYYKCDKVTHYFDPYGDLTPPPEVERYFRNCLVLYNYDRVQEYSTFVCGQLCLEFLYDQQNNRRQ